MQVTGAQALGPFSAAFSESLAGNRIEVEQLELEPALPYGMSMLQAAAKLLCSMLALGA